MQFIKELFSVNEILTVSIMGWFVAQVLKTIINFILLGKFQLERMWGDGGMPSAHSATVCAMVIAAARSEGVSSAIFAVASVVAIITMHDAMGVRHETGEQAKVLNQMIEEWIDISEKNSPFLQNMHLKEMVGHTPLQVMAGMVVGICESVRRETGLTTAAISGGVFQNRLLLSLCDKALQQRGFTVLRHSLVPPNDGGIALGQAIYAMYHETV